MPEYKVRLVETDADAEALITLPFVPFPALWLRLPWRGMNYAEADAVYWDDERQQFDVFFNAEEEET
jgi:hypothetical protein